MKGNLRKKAAGAAAAMLLGLGAVAGIGVPGANAAPGPVFDAPGQIAAPARTQITMIHLPSGQVYGTGNQHEARPALSLIKLYIADYVFAHGTEGDKAAAFQMLRDSSDVTATHLYARYPGSINAVIQGYGLRNTSAADRWGYSRTSTADVAKFLAAKHRHDRHGRLLTALATAQPIAADGYLQNYGTALLPGVEGTKWGWATDRRSFHSSASYGSDFVVAAATNGSAQQLSDDVRAAFGGPALTPGGPADMIYGSAGAADASVAGWLDALAGTGSVVPQVPSIRVAVEPFAASVESVLP